MRYRKRNAGLVLAAALMMTASVPVYAGDINAAEQSVLDYMNQIFVVDGKSYYVSDSAKSSAYAKFMQDDQNLTDAQAKAAIRQATKRAAEGVSDGYLVEVPADTENQGSSEKPGDSENPDTPTDPGSTETPGTPTDPGSTENPVTPTDPTTPQPGEQEPSTEPGVVIVDPSTGDSDNPGDTTPEEPKIKPNENNKVDIIQKIEAADGDANISVTSQILPATNTALYTVADYQTSELLVASEDGSVIYKGSLAIKNTGYNTGNMRRELVVLFFAAIAAIGGAAAWIGVSYYKGKKYEE